MGYVTTIFYPIDNAHPDGPVGILSRVPRRRRGTSQIDIRPDQPCFTKNNEKTLLEIDIDLEAGTMRHLLEVLAAVSDCSLSMFMKRFQLCVGPALACVLTFTEQLAFVRSGTKIEVYSLDHVLAPIELGFNRDSLVRNIPRSPVPWWHNILPSIKLKRRRTGPYFYIELRCLLSDSVKSPRPLRASPVKVTPVCEDNAIVCESPMGMQMGTAIIIQQLDDLLEENRTTREIAIASSASDYTRTLTNSECLLKMFKLLIEEECFVGGGGLPPKSFCKSVLFMDIMTQWRRNAIIVDTYEISLFPDRRPYRESVVISPAFNKPVVSCEPSPQPESDRYKGSSSSSISEYVRTRDHAINDRRLALSLVPKTNVSIEEAETVFEIDDAYFSDDSGADEETAVDCGDDSIFLSSSPEPIKSALASESIVGRLFNNINGTLKNK